MSGRSETLGVLIWLVGAVAALGPACASAQPPPAADPAATEAQCRVCHRSLFEAFAGSAHSLLAEPDWVARTDEPIACRQCHGDVADHIRRPGDPAAVFGFRNESPLAQSAVCLDCHGGTHADFDRSAHAQAGLTCTDCHNQHAAPAHRPDLLAAPAAMPRFDRAGDASRLCADCHGDVMAEFNLNERHRLLEGALECTSCHDPHEAISRRLLGGFDRSGCADCHADKDGPFVFEHVASRTEGCAACHSPHGSPNRHLLLHDRVAELCTTCHAAQPPFHLGFGPAGAPRFNLDTQCTNCHSTIHGSNFDPDFLR